MGFAGFVTCPNCQSPLDTDVNVCPYCYSTAPASAPWKGKWNVVSAAVVIAVLGTMWIAQNYLGIDLSQLTQEVNL